MSNQQTPNTPITSDIHPKKTDYQYWIAKSGTQDLPEEYSGSNIPDDDGDHSNPSSDSLQIEERQSERNPVIESSEESPILLAENKSDMNEIVGIPQNPRDQSTYENELQQLSDSKEDDSYSQPPTSVPLDLSINSHVTPWRSAVSESIPDNGSQNTASNKVRLQPKDDGFSAGDFRILPVKSSGIDAHRQNANPKFGLSQEFHIGVEHQMDKLQYNTTHQMSENLTNRRNKTGCGSYMQQQIDFTVYDIYSEYSTCGALDLRMKRPTNEPSSSFASQRGDIHPINWNISAQQPNNDTERILPETSFDKASTSKESNVVSDDERTSKSSSTDENHRASCSTVNENIRTDTSTEFSDTKDGTKSAATRQMCTSKNEKTFTCNTCKKEFSGKYGLNKHMLIHTGEKPHACNLCPKTFTYKRYLTSHLRTHTGEKPYQCRQCGKAFTQKGNLNSHMCIHTKVKPLKCEFCTRTFRSKNALIEHRRTHTRETPFHCGLCNKVFAKLGNLRRHIPIHAKENPSLCMNCRKCFSSRDTLIQHLQICIVKCKASSVTRK